MLQWVRPYFGLLHFFFSRRKPWTWERTNQYYVPGILNIQPERRCLLKANSRLDAFSEAKLSAGDKELILKWAKQPEMKLDTGSKAK